MEYFISEQLDMFLRGQEQAILDEPGDDKPDSDPAIVEGDDGGIANGKYTHKHFLLLSLDLLHDFVEFG